MKKLFVVFAWLSFLSFSCYAVFQPLANLDTSNVTTLAVSKFNPDLIFLASGNSVYLTQDGGKSFSKTHSLIGEEIKRIFFHSTEADIAYLVTSQRLYSIFDEKESLFSVDDEEEILAAAESNGFLYAGTSKGLYFSGQDYLNWQKVTGLTSRVYWIEPCREVIYLAASDGIYAGQKDRLERTFILRTHQEEETPGIIPNALKVDIFDSNKIWLATNKGLFLSQDKGESFEKFFLAGIDNLNIVSLAQTKLERNSLYLSTRQGFFRVDVRTKRSRALFEGLHTSRINQAEFSDAGKIYLATAKGAFTNQYFTRPVKDRSLSNILSRQPSIQFVHQKASEFNEVSAEKIKKWRRAASISPLFPRMSLRYDKRISLSTNPSYKESVVGPRDWGVAFTWDIGDLVWNPSHTSIDTRSRLNTQLRLDILESVNRIYFERLRLKKQLKSKSLSEEERFRDTLRLNELNAMLDYYTGGAFSKRLKELNER